MACGTIAITQGRPALKPLTNRTIRGTSQVASEKTSLFALERWANESDRLEKLFVNGTMHFSTVSPTSAAVNVEADRIPALASGSKAEEGT